MSEVNTLETEGNKVNEGTETSKKTQESAKTYTQEEFDRHMSGLRRSIAAKYEKQYEELGDINELKALKQKAEAKKIDDMKAKGEFEKVLQELAQKKDSEIAKRDNVIREYKINTPLLSAAAKLNAVNAEQVKSLLANSVRLNESGDVEVVDGNGTVRYDDNGKPFTVNTLVDEFLKANPHFKAASSTTTTSTKSFIAKDADKELDVSKLDMNNPEHKAAYKEYRKAQGLS